MLKLMRHTLLPYPFYQKSGWNFLYGYK